jgi:hypothetical protein
MLVAGSGVQSFAANSIFIQSRVVVADAAGVEVGIYIENDVDLLSMNLPLEIRQLSGTAFVTENVTFSVQGRVGASGLTGFQTLLYNPSPQGSNSCSGPTTNTYLGGTNSSTGFGTSPDGIFWNGTATTTPLASGSDGTPGSGVPSFLLVFDVNGCSGRFIIDTCCFAPANHVAFVDQLVNPIATTISRGTIFLTAPDVDSVIIESQTLSSGTEEATLGIRIVNSTCISGIVLPLEIRNLDGDVFISDSLRMDIQGRLAASGLTEFTVGPSTFATPAANSCSGPISNSYSGTGEAPDYVSPDAIYWSGVRVEGDCLPAGIDSIPSMVLSFGIQGANGSFLIDTCCVTPGNHLAFINCFSPTEISPVFVPGTVTLQNLPPVISLAQPSDSTVIGQGDSLLIVWNGSDPEDDSLSVGLWYDSDCNPANGGRVEIATAGLASSDSIYWKPTAVPDGFYRILGSVYDGWNDTVFVCASGVVAIAGTCPCECTADPQCDSNTAVVDAVLVIDAAFRGGGPYPDPGILCPYNTTDVDCNGVTNVVDAVKMIEVAFRGGEPAANFCDPCAP